MKDDIKKCAIAGEQLVLSGYFYFVKNSTSQPRESLNNYLLILTFDMK